MKITKEEFYKLYSEDITKKEYDTIISKIDIRFNEICVAIIPKRDRMWFDYSNCDYGSDDSGGYFDPQEYNEFISIGGGFADLPEPYGDGFPTRWLYEDFEDEFKSKVAEHKEKEAQAKLKAKNQQEELKARKAEMKKIIGSKLTKEELKYIKFK